MLGNRHLVRLLSLGVDELWLTIEEVILAVGNSSEVRDQCNISYLFCDVSLSALLDRIDFLQVYSS